jgi:hypothetical protein
MYTNIAHGASTVHRITSDVENLDLASFVKDGMLNLRLEISSGVTVSSNYVTYGFQLIRAAAIMCIDVTLNPTSVLHIVNRGNIWGANGYGGYTLSSAIGERGNTAIRCPCRIIIECPGQISGGGGGGGGGFGGDFPGGGGWPGGSSFIGQDAESSQFGFAQAYNGAGNANGLGLAGDGGERGPGHAGPVGYSIDADGNTVTVISGQSNITGDII